MSGTAGWMLVAILVLGLMPLARGIDVTIGDTTEVGVDSIVVDAEKNIVFIAPDAGVNASYVWDFGDGHTAEGMKVTHRFTTGGTFLVTLVTTNETGEHVSVIEVGVKGVSHLQNMALIAIGLMMAIAGIASAMGLGIAGTSAMAVSSEKEVKLVPMLILSALPFTQVIYAFAISFFILMGMGIIGGSAVPPAIAMSTQMATALFGIALIVGITGISAIPQGIAAGASLSAWGKREGAFMGGLIVSVMPEAVAMFGFVIGILTVIGLGLL